MLALIERRQSSNRRSPRRAGRSVIVALALTAPVLACARSPGTATTNVTSGTYDIETGACLCRLPQDEFLACCRSGMELTCRCTPSSSCFVVPTGRTCGKTPPAPIE